MRRDYLDFLRSKLVDVRRSGIVAKDLNPALFGFQDDVLRYLLNCGRGAAFLDTGLGKTLIQLDWARVVHEHTNAPVLILAPLAVAAQTAREGAKFGIEVKVCREQADCINGVNVANYERLQKFDPSVFPGIVLDESSILKSFMGTTKRRLCEAFEGAPYRLACTATPAPNDYMELGNHSAFLGIMPANEMLSRWFINDTMNFGNYRLKGHAIAPFWDWVASWARCVSMPSDLGFSDDGFVLPPLNMNRRIIDVDMSTDAGDQLFRSVELSATNLHKEKRRTADQRAEAVAECVVNGEPWVIWCDTDYEADELARLIPDAVEVRGSQSIDEKEQKLLAFTEGKARAIITKPSIAGFGLNWQHCANVAFVGVSYSYESFYQAIRRCWRFGQTKPVRVEIVMAQTEAAIWDTVTRKADAHGDMKREMRQAMMRSAGKTHSIKHPYNPTHQARLPQWLHAA